MRKNREIKFRIYDPIRKKMIFGKMFLFNFFKSTGVLYHRDKMEYQQFIGLIDINGKEIYEGDFLKGVVEDLEIFGMVEFDHHMPSYFVQDCQLSQTLVDEGLEIVGNWYENPELVNQTKSDK